MLRKAEQLCHATSIQQLPRLGAKAKHAQAPWQETSKIEAEHGLQTCIVHSRRPALALCCSPEAASVQDTCFLPLKIIPGRAAPPPAAMPALTARAAACAPRMADSSQTPEDISCCSAVMAPVQVIMA